jgi:hypothetical protein
MSHELRVRTVELLKGRSVLVDSRAAWPQQVGLADGRAADQNPQCGTPGPVSSSLWKREPDSAGQCRFALLKKSRRAGDSGKEETPEANCSRGVAGPNREVKALLIIKRDSGTVTGLGLAGSGGGQGALALCLRTRASHSIPFR